MNVYGKDKRGTIEVEPCPTCGKEVSQYCRFEPDYRRIQVPAKVITCRCGHEVVSYGAWDDGVSVKISDSLIRYDQRQRSLSKCRQIAENMMTNSRKELFV